MPIYQCNKCNYQTKVKQNIIKHLNKTTPCKNEVIVYNTDSSTQTKEDLLNKIIELELDNEILQETIIDLQDEIVNNKKQNTNNNKSFRISN